MSVMFVGIVVMFYAGMLIHYDEVREDCQSRWADSGHQSRFKDRVGCQVKIGQGWYPEASVHIPQVR